MNPSSRLGLATRLLRPMRNRCVPSLLCQPSRRRLLVDVQTLSPGLAVLSPRAVLLPCIVSHPVASLATSPAFRSWAGSTRYRVAHERHAAVGGANKVTHYSVRYFHNPKPSASASSSTRFCFPFIWIG